jgi:hypothetical protein
MEKQVGCTADEEKAGRPTLKHRGGQMAPMIPLSFPSGIQQIDAQPDKQQNTGPSEFQPGKGVNLLRQVPGIGSIAGTAEIVSKRQEIFIQEN